MGIFPSKKYNQDISMHILSHKSISPESSFKFNVKQIYSPHGRKVNQLDMKGEKQSYFAQRLALTAFIWGSSASGGWDDLQFAL